ncbi:hypothetical protein [Saccharicrinis aurantiacus]|uniref:hypothetical protein n=1 Tax=Saccharicrinis aurantiacus TaxID=1849719 RepID=UPI00094F62CE|nr:hypothetical protein [Saccharicrinis aurantiacus]
MFKITVSLLIVCAIGFNVSAQSKLKTSKDQVEQGSQSSSSQSPIVYEQHSGGSGSSFFDEEYSDNFFADLFVKAVAGVVYVSTVGLYGKEYHLHNSITKYPYIDFKTGNYISAIDGSDLVQKARIDIHNSFFANTESIYGNHLNVKFRPTKYLYIKADYRELLEVLPDRGNEHLSLFHATLAYDRIRFPIFNLGYSLGADYIASGVNKWGFTYGFNLESFAINNVSIYSEFLWSKINTQNVNTIELRASYHIKRWKFSLGYEHLRIANPQYNLFSCGFGVYL